LAASLLGILVPVLAIQLGLSSQLPAAFTYLVRYFTAVLAELALLGYALMLSLRKSSGGLKALGFRRFPEKPGHLALPLIGAAGWLAVLVTYNAIASALHTPWLPHGSVLLPLVFFHSPILMFTFVVLTCVVAPLAEEVYFRGVLMPALQANELSFHGLRLGRTSAFWIAALLGGAVFAISHRELAVLLPFTLAGALLGWIYRRADSIWANVLAHALYNAAILALGVHFFLR